VHGGRDARHRGTTVEVYDVADLLAAAVHNPVMAVKGELEALRVIREGRAGRGRAEVYSGRTRKIKALQLGQGTGRICAGGNQCLCTEAVL
jgi:hypothetical protein